MDSPLSTPQPRMLWQPVQPALTNPELLRRYINRKHGKQLANYDEVHRYSVEDYTFWLDIWDYLGMISSVPPHRVVDLSASETGHVWFPGARLNYAENLLSRNDDRIACTTAGEDGIVKHYTFRQLRESVRQFAAALRVAGLQRGDRVAAIISNCFNAVAIALATASIGAIFSSTAPDMGTQGILDRYRQIQPKFVFADTEVFYAGKGVNLEGKIIDVVRDLADKGLQSAILLPSSRSGREANVSLPNCIPLNAFLALGDGRELTFEQLPFDHPLFILYSSGTTGKPKCIVHSAGGVLLQTKKDVQLGLDLSPLDTYFQYTTTGWMMWTFMLSGLAVGARIILYDGSPFHPDIETFLKFINSEGISAFGTSPRFLAEVQGRKIPLSKLFRFESLRLIGCTGAVLTAPLFEWAQRAFGRSLPLISTSGGTDVCAAFVGGCLSLPIYSGEIQCKTLGMKIEVFSPDGKNIEHLGEPGELVCTRPHPSLPLFFWGDHSGEKYHDAYYSTYPGIWRHGDFIYINPVTKGITMLGRSDGVLNPSGVRFGSAEIYAALEQFSALIDDSICVGQRRAQDQDERVLLFVKMRSGHRLTPDFEQMIRRAIRVALSARHVPAHIIEVPDIPYTVNGKKIEIAVKQIVSGKDVQPSGTVANPESLKLYYQYRELDNRHPKAKL